MPGVDTQSGTVEGAVPAGTVAQVQVLAFPSVSPAHFAKNTGADDRTSATPNAIIRHGGSPAYRPPSGELRLGSFPSAGWHLGEEPGEPRLHSNTSPAPEFMFPATTGCAQAESVAASSPTIRTGKRNAIRDPLAERRVPLRVTGVNPSVRLELPRTYDPLTFRLASMVTAPDLDDAELQHLDYTYDPVGNIVRVEDTAQDTLYLPQTPQSDPLVSMSTMRYTGW